MKRLSALLLLSPLFLVALGCEASKSADPLSPSVAGPIAGVNITAPKPLEPNGSRVASDKQPVTLLAENASTTGVRPLSYVFEVATDAGFTNTVFSRDGIAPGDGGRTSLRLPDPLQSGRTYYWRARAQDGANTGPYSGPANFDVFTPIVIDQPTLIAPTRVVVTENLHPVFQWNNAPRSGPVGAITYFIELSDTDSFANKLAVWTTGEQPNQTNLNSPQDLSYGKIYFWHVKAYDPSTQGPWSSTEAFQTPLPPPPPPTGGGGGGGGGGVGGDWKKCSSLTGDKQKLSECVHDAVNPGFGAEAAFEVTKRIAWLLRGEGGGLLIKNGGENIVSWKGRSFAAGRICYPDGHIYKVLSDVGGGNGATWADNGFVDRSLYVPAIDPDS
jgi:hypothetical protein